MPSEGSAHERARRHLAGASTLVCRRADHDARPGRQRGRRSDRSRAAAPWLATRLGATAEGQRWTGRRRRCRTVARRVGRSGPDGGSPRFNPPPIRPVVQPVVSATLTPSLAPSATSSAAVGPGLILIEVANLKMPTELRYIAPDKRALPFLPDFGGLQRAAACGPMDNASRSPADRIATRINGWTCTRRCRMDRLSDAVDRLRATGMRGRIRPRLFPGRQQDRCGTAGGPSRGHAHSGRPRHR